MGQGWQPNPGSDRTVDDLSLDEWVGQALGRASACWSDLLHAGEFDSTACGEVLTALMAHLNEVIDGVIVGTTEAVTPAGDEVTVGTATTRELLRELEVRAAVGRLDEGWAVAGRLLLRMEQVASTFQTILPEPVLAYRTVGS